MLDGTNCLPLVFSCTDLCSQCERSLHAMFGLLSSLNHTKHVELLRAESFPQEEGCAYRSDRARQGGNGHGPATLPQRSHPANQDAAGLRSPGQPSQQMRSA